MHLMAGSERLTILVVCFAHLLVPASCEDGASGGSGKRAPQLSNVSVRGTSAVVEIRFTLSAGTPGPFAIAVDYRGGSAGVTWTTATLLDDASSVAPGTDIVLRWDTLADEPAMWSDDYQVRLSLEGGTGVVTSPLLTLWNSSWARTYGGPADETANEVLVTSDGGFLISGATASFGAGGSDAWVLKLDPSGTVSWQYAVGGVNDDRPAFVAPATGGGYTLVFAEQAPADAFGVVLADLGSDGTLVQARRNGDFTNNGLDHVSGLSAQTVDGGYVVTARTQRFGAPSMGGWVLHGSMLSPAEWQYCLDGWSWDSISGANGTRDGGCVLAGRTCSSTGDGRRDDMWLARFGPDGNCAWQFVLGDYFAHEQAGSMTEMESGVFFVTGGEESWPGWLWFVVFDQDAQVLWERRIQYADPGPSVGAVTETEDGDFVVAGSMRPASDVPANLWLLCLSREDGSVLWERAYGGGGIDGASAIARTPDGGLVVVGTTTSFGAGGTDLWVLRLAPDHLVPPLEPLDVRQPIAGSSPGLPLRAMSLNMSSTAETITSSASSVTSTATSATIHQQAP
jgi:hypothetical protein